MIPQPVRERGDLRDVGRDQIGPRVASITRELDLVLRAHRAERCAVERRAFAARAIHSSPLPKSWT